MIGSARDLTPSVISRPFYPVATWNVRNAGSLRPRDKRGACPQGAPPEYSQWFTRYAGTFCSASPKVTRILRYCSPPIVDAGKRFVNITATMADAV